MPADTLFHSTTTVPLKRAVSSGRRTRIRVRKAASVPGLTVHRPSVPRSPSSSNEVAVPATRYSVSVYPRVAKSKTDIRSGARPSISSNDAIRLLDTVTLPAGTGGADPPRAPKH